MAEADQEERRKNKRIHFIKEVEVVGVGIRRCQDLSVGGMDLDTHEHFPAGTHLNLRFKLHDKDPQPIQILTRVLYVHDGVGIGLGFIDLKPEDQAKILKFVEE
ncbi:MAG TPA: PilZ domain-containing protein [Nitrospiria bacterium]|jgi:c-di-GMP-binding flagellar brake protein YcgR|nr:PilZ domain-containing protein [Nitrospiria bacterium]